QTSQVLSEIIGHKTRSLQRVERPGLCQRPASMIELLERDAFLSELSVMLNDALAGQGRIALVSGEAGIGKTSLVENFTRTKQDAVRVFWGTCDSFFTPRPL
ncbi:MAG: AAA family ATPase, partial [Anaerolineales bacterium]